MPDGSGPVRKLVPALLALVLVVAGAAVLAGPAQAVAVSASVRGLDNVLYDDCRAYPYAFAVTPPDGAGYWSLDTTLVGPDGRVADTDYVPKPTTGTSTFTLCTPADRNGTYTIRATLSWGADETSVDQSARLADAQFHMRKPRTRTGLKVSTRRPAYRQWVTYRFRVRDERPDGYAPTAFAWVVLQKRVHGRWVRVANSRTLTHADGRVKLRLRYPHHRKTLRIRAVTQPSDRYARSHSTPIRFW